MSLTKLPRILRPGGVVVICDSMQLADAEELGEIMDSFDKTFHEPYYRDYIQDDLGVRLQSAGCEILDVQVHLWSRYTVARKLA